MYVLERHDIKWITAGWTFCSTKDTCIWLQKANGLVKLTICVESLVKEICVESLAVQKISVLGSSPSKRTIFLTLVHVHVQMRPRREKFNTQNIYLRVTRWNSFQNKQTQSPENNSCLRDETVFRTNKKQCFQVFTLLWYVSISQLRSKIFTAEQPMRSEDLSISGQSRFIYLSISIKIYLCLDNQAQTFSPCCSQLGYLWGLPGDVGQCPLNNCKNQIVGRNLRIVAHWWTLCESLPGDVGHCPLNNLDMNRKLLI